MAQPPRYQRTKDFGADYPDQTDNQAINNELDAVSRTTDGLRTNLAKIQRDDGGLRDGVVTKDALAQPLKQELYDEFSQNVTAAVQTAQQAAGDANTAAIAAEASATSAATSAADAAGSLATIAGAVDSTTASAAAASASAIAAAASETNAATSASQALASKNAAATSEANAGTAANAAALSATSASDSKTAAAVSETNAAHSAELAEAAVDQITGNGIWVGSAVWWSGTRTSIPAGLIPADGQEAPHTTYPDLHTAISTGVFSTVSETDWQADPLNRGKFVIESSTGNLRVPDLNGKSVGSIGALYATGDGAQSPGASGNALQDAIQNITGEAGGSIIGPGSWTATSALYGKTLGTRPAYNTPTDHYSVGFDASRSVRTDTYTRPSSVSGVWCIQAFGAVVNPGSVDAAQLASDLAALDAVFQTLAPQVASGNVGLGAGQTWQNLTASRAVNTTYTNTTGRPVVVSVCAYTSNSTTSGNCQIQVDGVSADYAYFGYFTRGKVSAVVPAGSTYKVVGTGLDSTLTWWAELR